MSKHKIEIIEIDGRLSSIKETLQEAADKLEKEGYEIISSYPIGTTYTVYGDANYSRDHTFYDNGIVIFAKKIKK